MTCGRCGGLLRSEPVHWRSRWALLACMACGDRTDDTILANRRCMAAQPDSDWKTRIWARVLTLARMDAA